MQDFNTEVLDYLYNNYAIAFIMCLLGSLIKDIMDGISNTQTLNIKKIFVSTIFSSFLVSAISDYIKSKVSFGGYIFVSLIVGMWGFHILKVTTNSFIMYVFIKKLFKNISGPLAKAVSDTTEEIDVNTEQDNENNNDEDQGGT